MEARRRMERPASGRVAVRRGQEARLEPAMASLRPGRPVTASTASRPSDSRRRRVVSRTPQSESWHQPGRGGGRPRRTPPGHRLPTVLNAAVPDSDSHRLPDGACGWPIMGALGAGLVAGAGRGGSVSPSPRRAGLQLRSWASGPDRLPLRPDAPGDDRRRDRHG